MVVLDILTRIMVFVMLVYMTKTIIKDIKNGELKDFFR